MIRAATLLALLSAVTAVAQTTPGAATQILVSGPVSRIFHGDSAKFSAVSRDAAGNVRAADVFAWTVSDANVLAVDAQGNVSAKGLGFAELRANVGNLRGTLMLQVVPGRIVVTPGELTIEAGDSRQFQARVLDGKGNEIPGVAVSWDIVNARLGTTVIAAVSRSGMVVTNGAGRFYVRARYNYAGQTSPFIPYAEGSATLDVKLKTSHTVREVMGTDTMMRRPATLQPRRTYLSSNNAGQIVFQGSLDGIGNGILMWENGTVRALAASGAPGPVPSGFIYEFQNFAVNEKGQVLSRALVAGAAHSLLLTSKSGNDWYGSEGLFLGGIEGVTSFFVTRCSLANDGQAVVRANFRLTGDATTYTGLFRFWPSGAVDLIASNADPIPMLKGGPATFEGDFGMTGDGTVFFRVSTALDNAIYMQQGYDAPARIVGIGDTLGAVRVTSLPGTTYLSFLVAPQGDLVTLATLSNNTTVMLHYPAGGKPPRQTTYRAMYAVYGVRDGNVLWYGDSGKGAGLQIWKPDNSQVTSILHGQLAGGDAVIYIDAGTLLPSGEVAAIVRGEKKPFTLVKATPGATNMEILAEAGVTPINGANSQLTFTGMVPGMEAPGFPMVQGGGDPWNLVELSAGNEPVPLLAHGSRYDGNVVFFGLSFNQVRRTPNGELYLFLNPFGVNVPNYGVYKLDPDGKLRQIIKFNMTWPDGTVQYTGSLYGVTDSGNLLMTSSNNRSHSRLYLWKDGTPRNITTNSQVPDWTTTIGESGEVIGWDNAVVTESGRVMAQLRFRTTATGLFLWEDGKFTEMAVLNKTKLLDLYITSFNGMRALGDRIYASFSMAGGGSALAEWVNGKWEILVSHLDTSPTGQPMAGIGGFDVNRKGEIIFLSNSFSWPDLLMRRPDGTLSIVAYTFDSDAFPVQLIRFLDLDLRDDGRIYFMGLDFSDRYVLFEAMAK